jgi:hypothetical protein
MYSLYLMLFSFSSDVVVICPLVLVLVGVLIGISTVYPKNGRFSEILITVQQLHQDG